MKQFQYIDIKLKLLMGLKLNRHLKHMNRLFKIAEAVEPVGAAKLASAIVINNKEVAFGFNSWKTQPLQKRFSSNAENGQGVPSARTRARAQGRYIPNDKSCGHAEIMAIKNSLRHIEVDDLKRATLYVIRHKSTGWGLAKPCTSCQRAIDAFAIKRVVYSCEGVGEYNIVD